MNVIQPQPPRDASEKIFYAVGSGQFDNILAVELAAAARDGRFDAGFLQRAMQAIHRNDRAGAEGTTMFMNQKHFHRKTTSVNAGMSDF